MRVPFTKMHGLGNDFVVFDATRRAVPLNPEMVRHLADRHFGIGCDQVLVVEPPEDPAMDFRYRIFNADGGEVSQCGNGARCFARFVRETGLTDRERIRVETGAGPLTLQVQPNGEVTVEMGHPVFEPARIPFRADAAALDYAVDVAGAPASRMAVLGLGNPHAVLQVDDIDVAPVATVGPALGRDPRFPDGVNVGFMAVRAADAIDLRVHERGSGETLACGSGACAAVVAGRRWSLLGPQVRVRLPGGWLTITWSDKNEETPVFLTGPAERVFEGQIEL